MEHVTSDDKSLYMVIWEFKYKRRKYAMSYWFEPTPTAGLFRALKNKETIALFDFLPNWTPDNCQEKISKVLVFS